MPDRTRPIRKEICLNEQELNLVQHKMRQLGTHNFGAYARKMLIDGYIIKVDYTEQKKLAAAVSRAASNINQICRRINSTGHVYEDDVAELKSRQTDYRTTVPMTFIGAENHPLINKKEINSQENQSINPMNTPDGMDGTGGQMKTFCKLTTQSPAASYVPLPRFLLQDETLCDIINDAKLIVKEEAPAAQT